MKNYFDASGREVALDGEHEFNLESCQRRIKAWKSWYFKKNSKHRATIKCKCYYPGTEDTFWLYYLILSVNGIAKESIRIRQEAYKDLTKEPGLFKDDYPNSNVEFVLLESFNP